MLEQIQDTSLLASLNRWYPQETRLVRLSTSFGDALLAERVHGEEALSQGYVFKIDALCLDVHLQLRKLIGQAALLQLSAASSSASPRLFHGYITSAELGSADGDFVRCVLTIEPWSTFLSLGRDSRSFQDMTVFDILEIVFGSYAGRGKLVSEWRFDVADPGRYPKRSLTTQYKESDLVFVQRLMQEEGLFYLFEHCALPDSAMLGMHTMVVTDRHGAFEADPQRSLALGRPDETVKADIDRRREIRLTNVVDIRTGGQDGLLPLPPMVRGPQCAVEELADSLR